MKKTLLAILIAIISVSFSGCTDADVASKNLSRDADMFRINRRIIFYNGITNQYILEIDGFCSIKDTKNQLEVTCKTGIGKYKKHFLGLSDNVTYFAEQLDSKNVSINNYKVIFKPSVIIPDIEVH